LETKEVKLDENKVLNNTPKSTSTAKKDDKMGSEKKSIIKLGSGAVIGVISSFLSIFASLISTISNISSLYQKPPLLIPFIISIFGLIIFSILAVYFIRLKNQYKEIEADKEVEFQLKEQEIAKLKKEVKIQEPIVTQNKNAGIISIIPRKDNSVINSPFIVEKLKSARKIKFFFNTGYSFFGAHSKIILEAINENKTEDIMVLIAKEDSKFLDDIAIIEKNKDTTSGFLPFNEQVQAVKKELDGINKKTHKNVIEIRFYDTEFRVSMILIESRNDEKWGWLTLSLPPYTSVKSFSFEIESKDKNDDNIYNLCEKHFDAVWEKLDPNKPQ
jgi:hypothetical protein